MVKPRAAPGPVLETWGCPVLTPHMVLGRELPGSWSFAGAHTALSNQGCTVSLDEFLVGFCSSSLLFNNVK